MKVIAKQGTSCPKEGKPREYITDSEAVDVPETAYYKRLVDDGSLVTVEENPPQSPFDKGGSEAGGFKSKKGGKE